MIRIRWYSTIIGLLSMIIMGVAICSADTVYFHNNEAVNGTITRETEREIDIDVGTGHMTFLKDEIATIERGAENPAPEQILSVATDKQPATVIEELFNELRQLRETRDAVLKRKRYSKKLYERAAYIMTACATFDDMARELEAEAQERYAAGDVRTFNTMTREIVVIGKKKEKYIEEGRNILEQIIMHGNKLFFDIEKLHALHERFFSAYTDEVKKQMQGEDVYYMRELDREVSMVTGDFNRLSVESFETTCGPGVACVINETIQTNLSVDTKVPFVVLSRELARSLQVTDAMGMGKIDLLSFGMEFSEGVPVLLKSVRVGDIVVHNVLAVISDDVFYPDIHGILGIPFLRNFAVQIDRAKTNVALIEFKPE